MEHELPQITEKQLYNLINRLKTKKLGESTCTLSEFITWCDEHKVVPEDDDDKPFCVHNEYGINDESMVVDFFRAFLSTKRLLSFINYNDVVAADGTHKITYQGYPAIVIGTLDKVKRFHPFGIGLVYGETTNDYEFTFEALKKYKADFKPRILVADNAPAITNAYVSAFNPSDLIRVMCLAHVYRRIQLKRSLICDKNLEI